MIPGKWLDKVVDGVVRRTMNIMIFHGVRDKESEFIRNLSFYVHPDDAPSNREMSEMYIISCANQWLHNRTSAFVAGGGSSRGTFTETADAFRFTVWSDYSADDERQMLHELYEFTAIAMDFTGRSSYWHNSNLGRLEFIQPDRVLKKLKAPRYINGVKHLAIPSDSLDAVLNADRLIKQKKGTPEYVRALANTPGRYIHDDRGDDWRRR